MAKTIFTKIIEGEIPCTKIYEDAKTFVFLDINPVTPGHTLVITKDEYAWVQDVPDDLIAHLFITAKKMMHAIKKGIGCDYVQITVIGKDVPHAHVHLIPRWFNDTLQSWPGHPYKDGEANSVAEKIKNSLT